MGLYSDVMDYEWNIASGNFQRKRDSTMQKNKWAIRLESVIVFCVWQDWDRITSIPNNCWPLTDKSLWPDPDLCWLPSGVIKHGWLENPVLMEASRGKSPINGPFSSKLDYRRVHSFFGHRPLIAGRGWYFQQLGRHPSTVEIAGSMHHITTSQTCSQHFEIVSMIVLFSSGII